MVEFYQVHAALQALALVSFLVGAYRARGHKVRTHHASVYTAAALATLAVAIMVYESRGLPTIHGRLGFAVYLFVLATVLSGRLFLGGKIRRNQHRALAYSAIFLFIFQILHGLFTFVL